MSENLFNSSVAGGCVHSPASVGMTIHFSWMIPRDTNRAGWNIRAYVQSVFVVLFFRG